MKAHPSPVHYDIGPYIQAQVHLTSLKVMPRRSLFQNTDTLVCKIFQSGPWTGPLGIYKGQPFKSGQKLYLGTAHGTKIKAHTHPSEGPVRIPHPFFLCIVNSG